MTKTNNNKLKVLIFFFIGGLTLNHHTMENKRTHSQRQANEDDQITQIDTTSRKRRKTHNQNAINHLLIQTPGQPVYGFVHQLEDADMANGTLNTGEYHQLSNFFNEELTIGQNDTNVQIINGNLPYKINDANLKPGQGLGPFVTPKSFKMINERDIPQTTPLVNFEQLKKSLITYIQQDLEDHRNGDVNCFFYILNNGDYKSIVQLLIKKIKDPRDPFFNTLFNWVNDKHQSMFYDPNQDLSSIKETHNSNLFEDLTEDFLVNLPNNQRTIVQSILIDEAKDCFVLNFSNNQRVTYSINDGLTRIFFNTLFKDLPTKMKQMNHFLFNCKSTKQLFNIIPQSELYKNRTSTIDKKRYNDISGEIDFLSIEMKLKNFTELQKILENWDTEKSIDKSSLIICLLYIDSVFPRESNQDQWEEAIDKISKTLNLSNLKKGLSIIENTFYQVFNTNPQVSNLSFLNKIKEIQKQSIFKNFKNHFAIRLFPQDNQFFKLKKKEEKAIANLLKDSDALFLIFTMTRKIQEINMFQQLKRYGISPKKDKIFIEEKYNEYLDKIMESFKHSNYIDDFFNTLKQLKIFSIKGNYADIAESTVSMDCQGALFFDDDEPSHSSQADCFEAQRRYYPCLHLEPDDEKKPFDSDYMPLYYHRNLKNDILTPTKLYLSMAEDKGFLNGENTILEFAITNQDFFKKFFTTFYDKYGEMLLLYSQYNIEENNITERHLSSNNHMYRLGSRGFMDWFLIFNIIRPKLLEKYPLAFSYKPSINKKESYSQLQQALAEFLFHVCPMLIRNLLYNFSETHCYEECFGLSPKDQFAFKASSLLLEKAIQQMKKTIKAVVYLPNESGQLAPNKNLLKYKISNGEVFNYFPMDSAIFDHVDKESLTKRCIFNDKAIVEYLNNVINLVSYDFEKLFWIKSSYKDNVNVDSYIDYQFNHDKGMSEFTKDLIITTTFKELLKEPIANGLSGQDENQGTVTVYSTDSVVNGVFGLEPRPTKVIVKEFKLDDGLPIEKSMAFYTLSKTIRLDTEFIFKVKNSQFKFQNNYSKNFKYLQVIVQGYDQRKKIKALKQQNPDDQAIQSMPMPPRIFEKLKTVFLELNTHVLTMPASVIHIFMEIIQTQRDLKNQNK